MEFGNPVASSRTNQTSQPDKFNLKDTGLNLFENLSLLKQNN